MTGWQIERGAEGRAARLVLTAGPGPLPAEVEAPQSVATLMAASLCGFCGQPIKRWRKDQRFCPKPALCRTRAWDRDHPRQQLPLGFDAPQAKRTSTLTSFHARHETAEEALAGERQAQRQEDIILEHMRKDWKPYDRWTPSALNSEWHLGKYGWPITSVRRALTNLTTKGLLRKHPEDRRPGPRGARECTWSLA